MITILTVSASFLYAIAILYGINDLTAVVGSNGSFPLAVVYSQATGNKGATFGLLLIIFLSIMICVLGTFLTVRLLHIKLPLLPFSNALRLVEYGGP